MKRQFLAGLGFPTQALRIAVVRTPLGAGHAVLTVGTDRGDYVLDNLTSVIHGWDDTGYRWIERQDPGKGSGWALLGGAPDDVLTASISKSRVPDRWRPAATAHTSQWNPSPTLRNSPG